MNPRSHGRSYSVRFTELKIISFGLTSCRDMSFGLRGAKANAMLTFLTCWWWVQSKLRAELGAGREKRARYPTAEREKSSQRNTWCRSHHTYAAKSMPACPLHRTINDGGAMCHFCFLQQYRGLVVSFRCSPLKHSPVREARRLATVGVCRAPPGRPCFVQLSLHPLDHRVFLLQEALHRRHLQPIGVRSFAGGAKAEVGVG